MYPNDKREMEQSISLFLCYIQLRNCYAHMVDGQKYFYYNIPMEEGK